ncbi:hypothetical protein [Ferruginivarius sediminum]|uniref:Uncharacterized protein n=1 Tax=Ferruginivarius sediminum TaxID=2661937 RepID=A0A369TES1_9PROT|nr:hypothetical protein [Ferruginivarius sediminum]RDD63849.1 hypothetical protein DRB17_01395 [Ferruginivarius sediminum]
MLRASIVLGLCLLAAPAAAAETPPPLFTHTDDGPVRVMHGDSKEKLPLESASPAVRDFVGRANSLLNKEGMAESAALLSAIEEGRRLQEELDTKLVGTLYLEEAVRRLKQSRLGQVPVSSTNVVAAAREQYPDRLDKSLYVRQGVDDLGVDYATFAACLELAEFPSDSGPREVHVEAGGAIWTRTNGQPLAFDIVTYGENRLLVRSVVIGATRSLGFKDKLKIARLVLDFCI